MNEILERLQKGEISAGQAERLIKVEYVTKLDDQTQLDLNRHIRTGVPEAIFCETKSEEMVLSITEAMLRRNKYALLTRMTGPQMEKLGGIYRNNPDYQIEMNESGRVAYIALEEYQIQEHPGRVAIITAGTSDIPVAEESRLVLKAMGIHTKLVFDVGIAGIHRIFPPIIEIIKEDVDAVIVIAGMEGTLPGVVSALVDIPVIAVPTSTGYGLGAKGIGALTTMLQSCSPGMAVVNIDNGFGAATMAALIVKRVYSSSKGSK